MKIFVFRFRKDIHILEVRDVQACLYDMSDYISVCNYVTQILSTLYLNN